MPIDHRLGGLSLSKYQQIADALRELVTGPDPQWEIGDQFLTISEIQDRYRDPEGRMPSITTARAAMSVLVEEGLIETRQGSGTFVISTTDLRGVDLRGELADLREHTTARINTLLAALDLPSHSVTINLRDPADDNVYFVLTDALGEWADRQRDRAEQEDQESDGGNAASRRAWAATADRLRKLIDDAL